MRVTSLADVFALLAVRHFKSEPLGGVTNLAAELMTFSVGLIGRRFDFGYHHRSAALVANRRRVLFSTLH